MMGKSELGKELINDLTCRVLTTATGDGGGRGPVVLWALFLGAQIISRHGVYLKPSVDQRQKNQ